MATQDWEVDIRLIKNNGDIVRTTKGFTSEQARAGWLSKNEDDIAEIMAWRDPE